MLTHQILREGEIGTKARISHSLPFFISTEITTPSTSKAEYRVSDTTIQELNL
ncbi:uncharacterized protein A4U43_C03F25770, partial [Asparagus officinalis]